MTFNKTSRNLVAALLMASLALTGCGDDDDDDNGDNGDPGVTTTFDVGTTSTLAGTTTP